MGSEAISDDSRGKMSKDRKFHSRLFPHISDNSLSSIPSTYTWTPSSELALFQAMISHKPAGK